MGSIAQGGCGGAGERSLIPCGACPIGFGWLSGDDVATIALVLCVQPRTWHRFVPPFDPLTMRFFRRYRYFLIFSVLLLACSVMVVRQFVLNQSRHVELREAFILLHAKGYTNET